MQIIIQVGHHYADVGKKNEQIYMKQESKEEQEAVAHDDYDADISMKLLPSHFVRESFSARSMKEWEGFMSEAESFDDLLVENQKEVRVGGDVDGEV